MRVAAADIEADGFLMSATKIHCGVVEDIDTGERREFTNDEELYRYLATFDRVVMHNGRMYDVPVLERIVGPRCGDVTIPVCLDTLLLSRLLWPDGNNTPARGHSLEKWSDFAGLTKKHADIKDWSIYHPNMLERCHSDVDIQVWLYKYIFPKLGGWGESIQLEHSVASIITKQIQNGFYINMAKVEALEFDLNLHRNMAMDELGEIPPWIHYETMKKPQYYEDPKTGTRYPQKGDIKGKGSTAIRSRVVPGPPIRKKVVTMFNPGSDDHIRRLFKEKYNWDGLVVGTDRKGNPRIDLTDGGKASVKAAVLEQLEFDEALKLARLKKIDKVLSFPKGWRKYLIGNRIHGDLITNGTVAGRMSHSKPNMGQNPATQDEDFIDEDGNEVHRILWGAEGGWGVDCRDVFEARPGWILVGMDAKALEGRMLGNRVAKYDGGAYAKMLEESDVHSVNQKLAGLPNRKEAKTFYFKFVYGGKTPTDLEDKMYAACPGLKNLKEDTINFAVDNGYVVGLDGRRVPVRKRPLYGTERTAKEKKERKWGVAVNNLLQGDGAVVMKQALVIFFKDAEEEFGPHGERWALCANVHDEWQVECEPEIADQMGKMMEDSITKAGEHFKMKIRLEGEYKKGKSWAETH